MNWQFEQKVDLQHPSGVVSYPDPLMAQGDNLAHTWRVQVYMSGRPMDLTGYAVTGYFDRSDGKMVPVMGSAVGHVASVALPQSVYVAVGPLTGLLRAGKDGQIVTLAAGRWNVRRGPGNEIVDPGHVVPSLEELLAKIGEMEAGTDAANAAADAANNAAASIDAKVESAVAPVRENVSQLSESVNNLDVQNIRFTRCGAQLFDFENANKHGYYNNDGRFESRNDMTGGYCVVNRLEKITVSENVWSAFLDKRKNFISAQMPLTANEPIEVPENAYYFYVSIASQKISQVIVNSGDSVKPQTEFKRFIDAINPNYENLLEKSISCGANLFNKNTVIPNHIYHYENGDFRSDNYGYSASDFIKVEPECVYGLNVVAHVCYWDKNKDYISGVVHADGFQTITTPVECKYITISVQNVDGCILSRGETQTPYEAYTEYLKYGRYKPYHEGFVYKKFHIPKTKSLTSENNVNTAYLKLPKSYTPYGAPTKLCILTHGASMGISDDGSNGWTYNSSYNKIVTALTKNGYAVIDSNGYDDSVRSGHEHWGCPQALAGYYKAYAYFTENYNLEKNVYLYGFSMGGLTALNLMANRSFPIKCAMIAAPVISLEDQCVGSGSPNSDFLIAYGMGSFYDASKCRGYDRYKDIVSVGGVNQIFKALPPIFCAYGLSDTNISNVKIFDYFTALQNSNYDALIIGYTGGHEISYGGNQDVINDMIKFFNYY